MEKVLRSSIPLLVVLLLSAFSLLYEGLPAPLPATSPQNVFSADRAINFLPQFASAPHPIGSAAHNSARDFLFQQFAGLGLPVQIQRTTGVTARYRVAGTVENIVARLKGTSGASDAVALVAHYDSVAAGPGAADDGAGVITLLEVLRNLRAGPPLRNDIIFLLTDGEEDGLLGASAFEAEHPWAKDVRVVVNFEARGNSGPSQMFETSAENGRLMQLFAKAVPYPFADSLTYEVYQHMPNDTDMTVFKKYGAAGLNFAFIGHWEAYHTPLDNAQSLNRRTIQQQGDDALALARTLGNAGLANLREPDAVYFSLPGNLFVHYSSGMLWPFVIVAGILLLAALFFAKRAWQTTTLSLVAGFFVQVVLLVLAFLIGFGFVTAVRWMHFHVLPEGPIDENLLYTLGLVALLTAILTAFYNLARKKIHPGTLFLSGCVILFIALALATKWLPGGSYIFFWPLVAGLLASLLAAFRAERLTSFALVALCLLSLPAIFLFVPLLQGYIHALGLTPLGAPLFAGAFGILFLLLYPFLEAFLSSAGKYFAIFALASALALCAIAAKTTRYSFQHPKPSELAYGLDSDNGKAVWFSTVHRVDAWTAKYLTTSPDRAKLPGLAPEWPNFEFLTHPAPSLPFQPPQAVLEQSSPDATGRTLLLRITSPRHARTIHVNVSGTDVLGASVNGRDLGNPGEARRHPTGPWGFDYANLGDGIDLKLQLRGTQTVTVALVDSSSGIPEWINANLPPRPPDSMPIDSGDQVRVRRSFSF